MTSVPVQASAMTDSTDSAVPGRSGRGALRFNRASRRVVLNLLGVLVALFALFPVLWMISTAFKPPTEIYSLTPHPVPLHPTLANFRNVFSGSVIGKSYWNFLKNSLFITLVAVALSALIGLLAAIALIVRIAIALYKPNGYSAVMGGAPHPTQHTASLATHLLRVGFQLFPWIALSPPAIVRALDDRDHDDRRQLGGALLVAFVLLALFTGWLGGVVFKR